MSAFFAILGPLEAPNHYKNQFCLVEEVLSINLVIVNLLRIGFRNEYSTFTSENEVDLDDLHISKIGFKNGSGIGSGNGLGKTSRNGLGKGSGNA